MVHYRSKSPTSAYKTYLYLQAKMGHKANQTRAAKPTASLLLAVQGMYTNRRTRTNTSISSNTLFTLLSVTVSNPCHLPSSSTTAVGIAAFFCRFHHRSQPPLPLSLPNRHLPPPIPYSNNRCPTLTLPPAVRFLAIGPIAIASD
ncbi:hypothetical protein GW17_00032808 [Ensete ventricosum]|nr:hypothetical protein GW17_00032808 [Ensete ventricosum]